MEYNTVSYHSGLQSSSPQHVDAGSAAMQKNTTCTQQILCMDDFANFQQIGKGKDSRIFSTTCEKLAGKSVVLKVYEKAKITATKQRSVKREARIMKYLTQKRIPNITTFTGAFQDHKQMYIVMEHCSGGDLLEQLLKEGRAMTEQRVAQEVAYPMLTTLAIMHKLGIIHRDIKLENIFIDEAKKVKLGDFGLALCVHEERAISPVGTLEYMAPEVLQLPSSELIINGTIKAEDVKSVGEKVDIWSMGVTIFELVTGRSPFDGSTKEEIKKNILGHNMRPLPSFLTKDCQDFILKMMTPDTEKRPSAEAMLRHPWMERHLKGMETTSVPAVWPIKTPSNVVEQAAKSWPSTPTSPVASTKIKMDIDMDEAQPSPRSPTIPAYNPSAQGASSQNSDVSHYDQVANSFSDTPMPSSSVTLAPPKNKSILGPQSSQNSHGSHDYLIRSYRPEDAPVLQAGVPQPYPIQMAPESHLAGSPMYEDGNRYESPLGHPDSAMSNAGGQVKWMSVISSALGLNIYGK